MYTFSFFSNVFVFSIFVIDSVSFASNLFFKRNFISRLVANLRRFKEVRPNELFLKFIEEKKKQYPELTHIVSGHSHPPEVVEFEHLGVNVRIMPQGYHDLSFDI